MEEKMSQNLNDCKNLEDDKHSSQPDMNCASNGGLDTETETKQALEIQGSDGISESHGDVQKQEGRELCQKSEDMMLDTGVHKTEVSSKGDNSCQQIEQSDKSQGDEMSSQTRTETHSTSEPSVCNSSQADSVRIDSVSLEDGGNNIDAKQEEYEAQHFGFTPKSFVNGVYNAIVEYLKDGLFELENFVNQEFSDCISGSQSREGLDNILLYMVKKLESRFDALEKYLLKNILHIPSNVVLTEDQVQMKCSYTKQDELELNDEVEALKKKVMTIKYANAVLQQEISDIEEMQKVFDQTLGQLQQLQDITTKAGVSDLRDSLSYSIEKVQKLISVVQGLEDI